MAWQCPSVPGASFTRANRGPASRIFMAIGEKDQISGVEPCQNLAKEYAAAGGNVTVKLYPGAPSGFDGHPAVVQLFHDPVMETFVDCNVLVEPDGRSTYVGKTFAESDTKGIDRGNAQVLHQARRIRMDQPDSKGQCHTRSDRVSRSTFRPSRLSPRRSRACLARLATAPRTRRRPGGAGCAGRRCPRGTTSGRSRTHGRRRGRDTTSPNTVS